MAQIEEILGLVDAYGYAKKWGFELSRDDFGRVMANLPQTLIDATELAEKATAAAVPLSITKEPPLNVNVTSGGEVNLTLEATGHELTYVWQKKASGSEGTWEPVRTSDQPEYSFYFSDASPALYRCVLIDDFNRMMKSSVTTVTVVQAGDEGVVENPVVDEATYYQMQEILDAMKEFTARVEGADESANDAALEADRAKQDARTAMSAAQSAAQMASAFRLEANESAANAKTSEDEAKRAEGSAKNQAALAAQSQNSAYHSKEAAEQSAANASTSEGNAAESEQNAERYMNEAREAREAAAGYAGAATMGMMVDSDGDLRFFYKHESE